MTLESLSRGTDIRKEVDKLKSKKEDVEIVLNKTKEKADSEVYMYVGNDSFSIKKERLISFLLCEADYYLNEIGELEKEFESL